MDALLGLIISLSVTVVGGIVTAVKEYKQRKSKKKMKKRLDQLEKERSQNEPINDPPPSPETYTTVNLIPFVN